MKNTKEIIDLMQAFEMGDKIECTPWYQTAWRLEENPVWDWHHFNYRVAPAAPKTVKGRVKYILFEDETSYRFGGDPYPEVEIVVDGGSDEKLATTGKPSDTLSATGTLMSNYKLQTETKYEDGSPQLEVERLEYMVKFWKDRAEAGQKHFDDLKKAYTQEVEEVIRLNQKFDALTLLNP